jgi:soluble lytic murein transglycosylase-like protein
MLSVLSWIVVAALFARVPAGLDDIGFRAQRTGAAKALAPDWYDRVLRSSSEIFPGSPRSQAASVLPVVVRYAKRFGVDPLTVLAVIQVESQFDPKAVSSAGAMGLMQLQPGTARTLADELGLEWTGDDLLFDPDVNVLLGTCYLRHLLDRFGDADAALAAYCSGPTFVEARRDAAEAIPLRYSDRVWDVLKALQTKTAL